MGFFSKFKGPAPPADPDKSQALAQPHEDAANSPLAAPLGGPEAIELKQQLTEGKLDGLRAYLSRSRADQEWQDRTFMLDLLVGSIRLPALDFACEAEPDAGDLAVTRCAFFCDLAIRRRGSGTADQVGEARFRDAAACIQAAVAAGRRAAELDGDDPTSHVCLLRPLMIFSDLRPMWEEAFERAIRLAPGLVPARRAMVTVQSERWGGSRDLSLEAARAAMASATSGSDMAACLFWAHLLAQTHLVYFDNDRTAAAAYLRNGDVRRELDAAFDAWTQESYVSSRSSIPYLHHAAAWYYLTEDRPRLQRALSLVGNTFSEIPWNSLGNGKALYARAQLFATGKAQAAAPDIQSEHCLAFLKVAGKAVNSGNNKEAEVALALAVKAALSAPGEDTPALRALVGLHMSQFRQKLGREDEASKLREEALASLDVKDSEAAAPAIQYALAGMLQSLNEYRRALGFWNRAIQGADESIDPSAMIGMLHNMGKCYCSIGLHDQGVIPLRAAVALSKSSGYPSLAAVLLSLGNALRKRFAVEAEACYREAAEIETAAFHHQSATHAFVNLGILCSEQGRHEEALQSYEKALRVREQTPGTPAPRIASVLNNLANCYRRMGKFSEAHASADRAIRLLGQQDAILPSAYGTRGLIFFDSGDDAQAVLWLRKASTERMKWPSPDLQVTAENLENEIAALRRLGRAEELADAEQRLTAVRTAMESIPEADKNLATVEVRMEAAMFIELAIGSRPVRPGGHEMIASLAARLSQQVQARNAGHYSGWVQIPENTTLIFYGPDADALYQALAPILASDRIAAGARVVLQQDANRRELIIGGPSSKVN